MNDLSNILPEEMDYMFNEAVRLSNVLKLPGNKVNYKLAYEYFESNMREYEADTNRAPIACKKGCGFCCYLKVEVMTGEADHIVDMISKDWQLKERASITKLQERLEASNKMPSHHAHPGKPCVFLDQNTSTCTIYENRPIACRSMVVVSKSDCEKNHTANTNGELGFHKQPKLLMSALALAVEMISRDIQNLDVLLDALFGQGEPLPNVLLEEGLLESLSKQQTIK